MDDFFDELGWVFIAIIGGAIGLDIFFNSFLGIDSPLATAVSKLVGSLM